MHIIILNSSTIDAKKPRKRNQNDLYFACNSVLNSEIDDILRQKIHILPLWTAIGPYPHHCTSKYFIIINIIWINIKILWTERWHFSRISPNLFLWTPSYSLKLINISCKCPNHIFNSSLLWRLYHII